MTDADRARAWLDNAAKVHEQTWQAGMVSTTMMDVESLAAEFAAVRREAMEAALAPLEELACQRTSGGHDIISDPLTCDEELEAAIEVGRAASTDRGSE
jgi:hypothetical protein